MNEWMNEWVSEWIHKEESSLGHEKQGLKFVQFAQERFIKKEIWVKVLTCGLDCGSSGVHYIA